ncbi:hypothetical protein H1R20_g5015, partial [Candolleomyces eurysporus]
MGAQSDIYRNLAGRFEYEQVLIAAGTLFIVAVTGLAVWRLYFHQLARFPGPKIAALTDYYVTYYDLVKYGATVHQLEVLHQRYGPVVRIGPNKLHFSDLKAFDDIYRNNRFIKDRWFYDCFLEQESSFGYIDQRLAKERKDILRPLFSRTGVLRLEHVIQDAVDRFIDTLGILTSSKEPIDLHLGFMAISMEIITTYCFAKSYNTISSPGFRHPVSISLLETSFPLFLMQHFPILTPFLMGMPPWLARVVSPGAYHFQRFRQSLEDQVDEILNDPTSLDRAEHEIIYHHLLNPKTGAPPPEHSSLIAEASVMVAAGSDTVANTCMMGVFRTLSDKNIEQKLRQELAEAWPEVDERMSLERLEKLPYLTAVIKESLRLSHGVVSPLPRIVPHETRIGDVVVPQSTIVGMGQSFVHLNPDIFPNPKAFDPSRWFGKNASDLESYLVPFSKGPRSCLGLNLAWAELYLILGTLFRKVDLELFGTLPSDFDWGAFLVPRYHGTLRVKVIDVQGTREVQ